MAYQAKDYSALLGMEGFSENLLKNHFTLYNGYVANTNKLLEAIQGLVKDGKTVTPEFAECKRRLGWEWNGMRLHEYYFENLGGNGALDAHSHLFKKIEEGFGAYEEWEKEFKVTAIMRGVGWVILYRDMVGDRLIISWINEHDVGHLSGGNPLLVLDVFEHAFMLDYGLKRADYVEAFFRKINWDAVGKRLRL